MEPYVCAFALWGIRAYAPSDVRNPRHPNHNKMRTAPLAPVDAVVPHGTFAVKSRLRLHRRFVTGHPFGFGSTDHPQAFSDGTTGLFLAGKTE